MIRSLLATAAVVALAPAAPAAVVVSFAQGVSGFQSGDVAIADFDTTFGGAALAGAQTGYYTGLTPSVAAAPAGDATQYLAVARNGTATFTFGGAGYRAISFDVGSVDSYNSVTFLTTGGSQTLTGSQITSLAATGNQSSPLTNGRLTLSGNAGEVFTGLILGSSDYSFEVDNLATIGLVPEPATWAMFILGFAAVGYGMRRRPAVRYA